MSSLVTTSKVLCLFLLYPCTCLSMRTRLGEVGRPRKRDKLRNQGGSTLKRKQYLLSLTLLWRPKRQSFCTTERLPTTVLVLSVLGLKLTRLPLYPSYLLSGSFTVVVLSLLYRQTPMSPRFSTGKRFYLLWTTRTRLPSQTPMFPTPVLPYPSIETPIKTFPLFCEDSVQLSSPVFSEIKLYLPCRRQVHRSIESSPYTIPLVCKDPFFLDPDLPFPFPGPTEDSVGCPRILIDTSLVQESYLQTLIGPITALLFLFWVPTDPHLRPKETSPESTFLSLPLFVKIRLNPFWIVYILGQFSFISFSYKDLEDR